MADIRHKAILPLSATSVYHLLANQHIILLFCATPIMGWNGGGWAVTISLKCALSMSDNNFLVAQRPSRILCGAHCFAISLCDMMQ